jgi:uncharacterized protein (TIGR03437 family)
VKTIFAIFPTLGLLAVSGLAQPTVTQVSNAASFSLTPLQNSNIAEGAFFSIFGTGFGGAVASCGAGLVNCAWSSYPLPTTVANTSVSVVVGNTTVAPFINIAVNFGTYSQINAVLPSTTPPGSGTVTVTYNGSTSVTFPITVVASTFGAFAINQAGTGPGVIFDNNLVVTPFQTAKPGDTVVLWGSGLGPAQDTSTEQSAPPTHFNLCGAGLNCPVTVWVAGQKATIAYAGRSTYTAIDQVDFVVPTGPGVQGCYVQVAVQTGTVISNVTSMAVDANGAVCQDDDGINYNDIASAVAKNGSANLLAVSMLSNYLNLNVPALGGTLQWDNDTITGQIGTFDNAVLYAYQGLALAPSVGNCTVQPFLQYPPPSDPATTAVTFLNAGSALGVGGPNGNVSVGLDTVQATGKTVGYGGTSGGDPIGGETIAELISGCGSTSKNNCLPYFLNTSGWGTSSWTYGITPGTYTVTGSGGSSVGAFSGGVSVSSAGASFKWTNPPSSSIPRNTPLTITWTGGDPNGFVDITAVSSTLLSGITPSKTTPGILVLCMAPASAGTFSIPTWVLQSLPSTASSTALVPPGELLVGPASGLQSITPPSGLDAAYIFYHFVAGANVTWQ